VNWIKVEDRLPELRKPFSIGIRMKAQDSEDVLCKMEDGSLKVDRRLRNFDEAGYDSEGWKSCTGEVEFWAHIDD